jgi:undecaprenyl-diphosphatase
MSTITAGELMGLSRSTALEFSFLLSIPTMVAATGYDLVRFVRQSGVNAPAESSDTHGIVVLLIGFVMSFVVAWGVVAWLMRWVRRRGFVPFAIYRIIVGGAVLGWLWR